MTGKMKVFCSHLLIASFLIISCNLTPGTDGAFAPPAVKKKNPLPGKFTLQEVDNKLDPSCMMPLAAGIGDTLYYKGYVLGFCSTDCKKDFFKDPMGNLRLAQIKKIQ
jgi:hypothetical protein